MNQHKHLSSRILTVALSGICFAAKLAAPAATVYNGLLFPQEGAVPGETGYFRLDVSRNGHFSGKLLVGPHREGFGGKFDAGGTAYVQVKVSTGDQEMILNADGSIDYRDIQKVAWTLVLQVTNGLDQVTGQIFSYEHSGWGGIMVGTRAGYRAPTNPAPQAGRYTVIFPGNPESQSSPAGDGWATLTVDKAGNVRLAGALADDSRITAGAVLSAEGVWPLFVPTDGGRGLLMGWLQFTNSAESEMAGQLSWVRFRHPGARFYAQGFTNQTSVLVSSYVRPSNDQPVLNFSNAVLVLHGGELGSSLTNALTLQTPTKLRGTDDSRFVVSFTPANGLFVGAANAPGLTQTLRFKGAVLQDRNGGFGYFTGHSRSGEVIIQKAAFGTP